MKCFLSLTFIGSMLWADGGIIPPQYHKIYGEDQVAVIKILPDSEELSILVKFSATDDYQGFAWIVPLPALPEIGGMSESLFINLSALSGNRQRYGGCGTGYYETYGYGEDYFKIIKYTTIGFLQAVLIQTDNADTLTNWLVNNGYEPPEGATAIFQDYINRSWQYFFVARADTGNFYYANTGVRLKFPTDTIVYPMKISSISSSVNTTVYLYTIGAHKMFFENAELLYANRISERELSAIEEDLPYLYDYIKQSDYITKLRRTYKDPYEMNADIILYQSPDDIEYRSEEYPSYRYLGFINSMLLPFLLYTIYLGILKIKKKKRIQAHKTCMN